jgi:DNA end-binding protein Ku
MAPRSIWNGTITFGLVNVPVKLYTATESKSIHFHLVHARDGSRVENKRICSKEDKEVPYKQVIKGYEVSEDKYVVLEKDEIKAAAGDRGKVIHLDDFVEAADIDPVFYEKTYHLGAGDKGRDAYALLHAALGRSGRAGVGRWVFHNRERTVIVRPLDGLLALHTMRFADDLVDPGSLKLPSVSRKPAKKEIDMAGKLVEGLHTDFEPADYKDEHRRAVEQLIERKASGKQIEAPEEPEEEQSDDLMAALEASLA